MEGTLLSEVSQGSVEKLMVAMVDVATQIKDAEPNRETRFMDEMYASLLSMQAEVLRELRKRERRTASHWTELRKTDGKYRSGRWHEGKKTIG